MKEAINQTRNYTFLSWLIVPLLFTWIGTNYIVGIMEQNPAWNKSDDKEMMYVASDPFQVKYPSIEKSTSGLITIWFDDAWISQYMIAAPILKEANMKAAIAVPTDTVGYPNFANWAQLRSLQRDGWEIDNHSVSHDCSMESWSAERIDKEMEDATQELWAEKLTSDIFVAPCGVNSPQLIKEVQKKFIAYRGTEPGLNDLKNLDPYNLLVRNITNTTTVNEVQAWVQEAKNSNKWVILVFHQVDEESKGRGEDYSISLEEFKGIVEYLKAAGIPVVLPSQALSLRQIQ